MNELIPVSPFTPSPATRTTVFQSADGKKHSTQEEALERNHYLAFAAWRVTTPHDRLITCSQDLYKWLIQHHKEVSRFLETLPDYVIRANSK